MQKVHYQIYQVKKEFKRYHGFLGLESYKSIHEQEININRYNFVFEDSLKLDEEKTENEILEELFRIFNINHPVGFNGHSMSVGDIVHLNDKIFYCDSFGWEEIQPSKQIPSITLEEYTIHEHGKMVDELVRNELMFQYIKDDFKQFCYEKGYEPIL